MTLLSSLACLLILVAFGAAERVARDRAYRAVPIRIHVNGSRGKSTVTRLIWSALHAAGIPAAAKTTGTAARLILPDGSERPVRRLAPASIREQLAFLRLARRSGARAAVVECMALDPELQAVSERQMVRASVGVITNVRLDHTEVMGRDLESIARTLANTVPRRGVLVIGETACRPVFEARATAVATRVLAAEIDLALVARSLARDDARMPEGAPRWLVEDAATALTVTRHLGIADEVAFDGFRRVPLDPGTSRFGSTRLPGGALRWLDATAANDPESLALVVGDAFDRREEGHPQPLGMIYNHRADRSPRLATFAAGSRFVRDAGWMAVTGDRPPLSVWRQLMRARAGRPTDFVARSGLARWLGARPGGNVVFCGNTRGLDVAGLIEESSRHG